MTSKTLRGELWLGLMIVSGFYLRVQRWFLKFVTVDTDVVRRDKELALQELHLSNTKCASVTAERDRLRDRITEMEVEV